VNVFMQKLTLLSFFLTSSFSVCIATQSISHDSTVDDLFKQLKKIKTQTLLDAVNVLDKQFFKKENYVLIFDSMSPQGSRAEAPRVVLLGKDKKLRIGFSPHNQNGKNFEIIQWREVTKTWEFREITFSQQGPQMSGADPIICLQCHRDHKPKIINSVANEILDGFKPSINKEKFLKLKEKGPIYKKLDGLD
jgi:hypothetical protein